MRIKKTRKPAPAPSVRIAPNQHGNWHGYFGKHKVAYFAETSSATQEQNAMEWRDMVKRSLDGIHDTFVDMSAMWAKREARNPGFVRLSRALRSEVVYKLSVLQDSPEVQEGYLLTQSEVDRLIETVPRGSIKGWHIPYWAVVAVKEEMKDAAKQLRRNADECLTNADRKGAARENKLAREMEALVKAL